MLKRHENIIIKKNREAFQGTVNFKTRQQALSWIDSSLDAANSIPQIREHLREFEKNIVNTVFLKMGMQ